MVHAAKAKTVSLPKTFNLSTGKVSMHQTGFSNVAWGKATCSYTKSACSLTKVKFDAIIEQAQDFVKPTRSRGMTTQPMEVIDIDKDDEWVHLADNFGSEREECKLSFLSVSTELTSPFRILWHGSQSM